MDEISQTIKEALLQLKEKYQIDEKNIRIKIEKKEKLEYSIMNGKAVIEESSLKNILQLKGGVLDNIKILAIGKYLGTAMDNFKKECGHPFVSLLLFLKNNNEPSGYLFSEGRAVREVTLNEII